MKTIESIDWCRVHRDFAIIGLRSDLFLCREVIRDVMSRKPSQCSTEKRDEILFELCKEAAYMLNRLYDLNYAVFVDEN